MKPHVASAINAAALILLAAWGYMASDTPSPTALIPVLFGILLLTMNQGVMNENKAHAHVAVFLTLIVLIALVMPLKGAFGRGDNMAILRVGIMLLTTVIAMIAFVRSFIAAKKMREEKNKG